MNIRISDKWLREYLVTEATPEDLKNCLSLCGPSIERLVKTADDYLYDIEITSNRIDTASVCGIAREAVAILPRFGFKASLKKPVIEEATKPLMILPLVIEDGNSFCRRIMAIIMTDVKIATSPKFIEERLESAGVRSLNNIIDITNYVMLEIGHPLHVFDYDRIKNRKLIFRYARKNEEITTLDNKKYRLDATDIVIDDGTGEIIDLPGIMGSYNSVIKQDTKRVILFIETNDASQIRKTSMKHGIRTLAATYNEKNPSAELVEIALRRAIKLMKELSGAQESSKIYDLYLKKEQNKIIPISESFITSRLGIKIETEEILNILESLNFTVEQKKGQLLVIPPKIRQSDINIREDIVEEVARIYGYRNIPGKLMRGEIPITDTPNVFRIESRLKSMLKYLGFTEVYNYSFQSEKLLKKSLLEAKNHLQLANPLTAETEYMRSCLIPSLLENIAANQFNSCDLSIFELANVYHPRAGDLPLETQKLTLASNQSFFVLKGLLLGIFREFGLSNLSTEICSNPFIQKKQGLTYKINNDILGFIGQINLELKNNFNLIKELNIFEIDINNFLKHLNLAKKYLPIPKFPPIIEDITLILQKTTRLGEVINRIYQLHSLIHKITVIDNYTNSVTLRLTYLHPEKTLSNVEVKIVRNALLDFLKKEYNLELKTKD